VFALAVSWLLGVPGVADDRDHDRAEVQGTERSAPVTPFVFEGDLRYLPSPTEWRPGDPVKEIPRRFYPKPGSREPLQPQPGPDPLVDAQRQTATLRGAGFTVPSRNFPGQGYTGVNPPDTVGDVGPNHYIQMINGGGGAVVTIFDKAEPTPAALTTFALDSLGSGVCASGFGDPIVLYDRIANRWLMSEFSGSGNNLCVYISQTPDPVSGGWYAYGFTAPSFPDYPKYGVWPTDANDRFGSYVVTANDGGPGIYALDRGAMLSGAAATYQRVTIPGLPGFGFEAPTPADLDGPDFPPSGSPAIIMRHRDTEVHSGPAAPADLLEMWTFDVDWITSANSTLTAEPSIDVAEFDSSLCGLTSFNCFPQPGTGVTLDPLREVIMNRLQYMNRGDHETLVGNFVVDVDGNNLGGLRWFELRRSGGGAWTLHQEGTYSPDSENRWMAGSSMDESGNIAIGYNVSSTTTFPSLRYTGRQEGDTLGVLTQPETSIHAGTASNSSNRYGDYSAMNLDPEDDCTFWFTGMDNTSSNWRTQITSFKFDACGCLLFPDPPTVDAVDNGDNRIDVSWDDSLLDTVVEYEVRRSRTPGGPYQTIAVVPDTSPGLPAGPGYVYEDNDVSGGITYYYVVVASDGAACESDQVNEASATATGPCILAPIFAGLESVSTPFFAICTLELSWSAATPECGADVTYDVYRSLLPDFTPDPTTLLVSGVSGTTLTDIDALVTDTPYYYVVRAADTSNGVTDGNLQQVVGVPQGELTTGTWTDDAGDTEPAKMIPSTPWQINGSEGNNGPSVYKTGVYGNNTCADLVTPELRLGVGSTLSFYSRYDIENSWDKGEVQISTDGGQSWTRVPVNYPGSSTNTADNCNLPTGTYFTGSNLSWALYSADLSTWSNQFVMIRFLMASDTSVTGQGWWVDDISITQVDVPGTCATGSSCADNPFVDVQPNGPLTSCAGTAPLLASTAGGSGEFTYQWLQDGIPIPGATESTFTPTDLGTYDFNCEVQAATCPDPARDGLDTEVTSVNAPLFDGVQSVDDPQASACSLNVAWNAASTICAGPLRYYVYRDTSPALSPTPDNLVASGLTATSFTDSGGLSFETTYYYLVRALDMSTAQFDANVAEAAAAPTGPGDGSQVVFDEDFESAASFDQWSTSIRPPSRTCGNWVRSSTSTQRPVTGSGFYAVANASFCGQPVKSTTLTSPVINVDLPGLQTVTLEYDLYYNFQNGGDTATVEVWDGSAWQVVWTDANADFNGHQILDVTAWAAGNPAFQVRYNVDKADQWLSVDNVVVTADVQSVCETRVGPPPVPGGAGATSPLRGDRLTAAGDVIGISWDASSCTAAEYNLLYGDLVDVASYTLLGSECSLGTSGSYTWNGVPSGDLFFLLVGTDGAGMESSWGVDSLLGERNGLEVSTQCSTTSKDTSGSCP
jgi:hypothetical protein